MTVVARPRLAWRGARRSLQFVLGLALLAMAATGSLVHTGAPGWDARPTTASVSIAASPASVESAPAPAAAPAAPAPVWHPDAAVPAGQVPADLARPATGRVTGATAAPRAPPGVHAA